MLTAAAGGFIFGVAGYFGASWFADMIDRPVQPADPRPAVTPKPPSVRFEDWDKR